ncbi:RING-H2 finger protein ATL16-like [Cynara cardunculus var. scolymus]|uniref:RING-H2 finger protein ATL16-like n=1 Tax=Cynara cardunculus var. scolymus TaxID=59895 RepID=UPI000D62B164|nr:RING-H2 finger protein ATL16-like [Cynara cardunculus var. scolymus]
MELDYHQNYNHVIHGSSSSSESLSPTKQPYLHSSHASFPIIAVAIIGIFATIFLLVFYYIFAIKCCLNWHRIDILRRFSLSRNRDHNQLPLVLHHPPSPHSRGLHESVIRSIPIFQFQKHTDSSECAVCLVEFQHNEKLRMVPNCAHVFHIDCIDVWLQNNPNCPLCRNSISISLQNHFPVLVPPPTLDFPGPDEDYVVIEFDDGEGSTTGVGERRNICGREDDRPNSGEPVAISPFGSRKKMEKKFRKKRGHLSSMGDECIDVHSRRKGDDLFSIQPIRRSFSMDSASDRQLYLAVQEIIQRNTVNNVDVSQVSDGCGGGGSSSSSRLRRGFFSFGHARSAVLPLHVKP